MRFLRFVGLSVAMAFVAGGAQAALPHCVRTDASLGTIDGGDEAGLNPADSVVGSVLVACALAEDPFFAGTRNSLLAFGTGVEVDPAAAGLPVEPVTAGGGGFLAQWRYLNGGTDQNDYTALLVGAEARGPTGEALMLAGIDSADSDHPGCGTCNLHFTRHRAFVSLQGTPAEADVEAYQVWQEFRTGTVQSQGARAEVRGPVEVSAEADQTSIDSACSQAAQAKVDAVSSHVTTPCAAALPRLPVLPAFPSLPKP